MSTSRVSTAWRMSGRVDEPGRPEGHGLGGDATARRGRAYPAPDPGHELTYRDVVVAAPPCGDGSAYTSLLDLTLLTGATLVAAPLPLVTAAMRIYKGTAAIVPRGTHVPGVPATRVFPVALSQNAVPRWPQPGAARAGGAGCRVGQGVLAARTRWPLLAAAGRARERERAS